MKVRTVGIVSATLWLATATADANLAKHGDSNVTFTAIGPAGLRIVGKTADLNVVDDGQHVSVTVPLAKLDTGISLRDTHMRDKYLEVGTYPSAQLTVDRASLKFPDQAPSDATTNGTMTIHGKSKAVSVHYHATRNADGIHVSGDTQVNMKDYGINVPAYLGITVKPDVSLVVNFSVSDS